MPAAQATMTPRIRNMTAGDRTPQSPATVTAGFTRALLDLAAAKGADPTILAERSGIDPEDLQDQDNRIPLSKYLALMSASQDLCDDPALALRFGEEVALPQMSIVGLICAAAETVGEARLQLNRYGRLMFDEDGGRISEHLDLVRDKDGIWLEATSRAFVDHPCLVEAAFARCVCGARALLKASPSLANRTFAHALRFTHAQPGYLDEYERVFEAPLVFGSDRNAILIDEDFLAVKLGPSNRYVFGILSAHAEALLEGLEGSKSTRGRVETLLMPVLHTGDANMDGVAGKLGLSRQTLLRKLRAEGTTFAMVLDDLRHRLALHYLSGRKVSVNETAYLVGFSEPAAFSRAFKRWTGSSPRSARAGAIEGVGPSAASPISPRRPPERA